MEQSWTNQQRAAAAKVRDIDQRNVYLTLDIIVGSDGVCAVSSSSFVNYFQCVGDRM